MTQRPLKILAAAVFFVPGLASAQALGKPAHPRSTAARSAAARARPQDATKPEAAPCPKGTWKDDPVCFGEGDRDALPVPSSGSVQHASQPNEPTIKPTANLNSRPTGPGPYQAGVVYQSNGNAVTSNYGGGVTVQLPF